MIQTKKIHAYAGMGIISLFLFAGCSLNDFKDEKPENNDEKTTLMETDKTPEEKTEETKEGKEGKKEAAFNENISDEAFETALLKYMKENPVEFGKNVDAAYGVYQAEMKKTAAEDQAKKVAGVRDISETDHIKGNKDAKYVLFEYSDYHCPYCKQFHPVTKEFLAKNEDVALVLRPYPGVHRNTSAPLHALAECVAKESGNDDFWKFTDSAFAKGTALSMKNVKAELTSLGVQNIEKIMACSAAGDFDTLVNESEKEAQALGIQGTPGSILKNTETGEVRFVNGSYPLAGLEELKAELK